MFCVKKATGVFRSALGVFFLLVIIPRVNSVMGQDQPSTAPAVPATLPQISEPEPSKDAVEKLLNRLEEAKSLDASVREKAIEFCKRAIQKLDSVVEWDKKRAEYRQAITDMPTLLAETKQALEKSASEGFDVTIPADASLVQLEQELGKWKTRLQDAAKESDLLAAEPKRRAGRRIEMVKQLLDAQKRLDDAGRQLIGISQSADPEELKEANRFFLLSVKRLAKAEMECCQAEEALYEADGELLKLRVDLARQRYGRLQETVKLLQDTISAKRQKEAEREAKEAQEAVVNAHPAFRKLAEENVSLVARRTGPDGLAEQTKKVNQELEQANQALDELKKDYKGLIQRVKTVGLTPAVGLFLRKQRSSLPDSRFYRWRIRERQSTLADVQFKFIELEEKRSKLGETKEQIRTILTELELSVPPQRLERIKEVAYELADNRGKYLDALMRDYTSYFAALVDLDTADRQILDEIGKTAEYIDHRVLWVRSTTRLHWRDVRSAREALRWLFLPENWMTVGQVLVTEAKSRQVGVWLFGGLLLGLFVFGRHVKRVIVRVGEEVAVKRTDTFSRTFVAMILTVLIAARIPGVLLFLAVTLYRSPVDTDFVLAVAMGLAVTGLFVGTIEVLREICLPKGLAESHFGWPRERLKLLRRLLLTFMVMGAVLVLTIAMIENQRDDEWKGSLGRMLLIAALLVVITHAYIVLHTIKRVMESPAKGLKATLRRAYYFVGFFFVLVPVVLAGLAVAGYYYTALQLAWRLMATSWLVLGVIIANAIVVRWLTIMFRRLAIKRARRRLEIERLKRKEEAGEIPQGEEMPGEPEIDLGTINAQIRQLLKYIVAAVLLMGGWGIWVDALPALGIFGEIHLWTKSVPGQEAAAYVTLKDLMLALLIVVLTVAAVRNIPGLLEVVILQRLRLQAGVGYAITAIFRYTISVVGVIVAFGMLGIGWSSVQWLVAAITVGLGFGLQEIFANFVSGLILLFERPIRIGDVVTVGETSGTVSRIRIRATTITDWDRKELVVPNKEFITGRLVNWTLSDKILRVISRVGIAYGSDTELVERLLLEVAHNDPNVLDDPKPLVLFKEFGDNSLNFDLRVYIGGIESYLKVWHDLNMSIDKAFRNAGVTIAFPQRDVHLDIVSPVEVQVSPSRGQETRD